MDHFAGCILGGAVGDALGAPIEFFSLSGIRKHFGPQGVTDFIDLNDEGLAEFTDDTQMLLFTAEGLLEAQAQKKLTGADEPVQQIYQAYLRWLRTQYNETLQSLDLAQQKGLIALKGLWKRKAPGNTCLSALSSGRMGQLSPPLNNSKGCGGVMRIAPIGLVYSGQEAFRLGAEAAAITHGHPSGYLASGCLAQIIAELVSGFDLEESIQRSVETLSQWPGHEETLQAVQQAVAYAHDPAVIPTAENIEKLGAGWVAEEALAISIYCALIAAQQADFTQGVVLAINHSGDSDSTGAITGNLLGLLLGKKAIPPGWLEKLELKDTLENIAASLLVYAEEHEASQR